MLDTLALEQHVTQLMASHKIPGLAIAVIHRGEITYANGFGTTSVEENGLPVTPRTLFRIGSTTKPLTGTAIMRLVHAGRLDLDAPVARYLPWLRFSRTGAEQQITLRMLLTHSSGLDSINNPYGSRDPAGAAQYMKDALPGIPFVAEPGSIYSYSNPGVALAGLIAAAVYGTDFGTMVKELVFDPLEMKHSTFDPLVALTFPFAFSHNLRDDGTLEVARPVAESTGQHGAGFAMTTVLDLANFAVMQMDGGRFGGRQLLAPETVKQMQTIHAPHYTVDGSGYGLTFFVDAYKGLKRVRHGGGIHQYNCSFEMLPEAQTAVVLMSSRMAPPNAFPTIIGSIFDQLLGLPAGSEPAPQPSTIQPDPATWPLYEGQYVSRLWGMLTVAGGADGLTLEMTGQMMPLSAHTTNIYFSPRPGGAGVRSVGFVQEKPDIPCRYLMVDSWTATRFTPDPNFRPDRALLGRHTGIYLSPATGREDIRLRLGDDGRLWARFAWYPGQEFPCTPLNSNTSFASGGGLFDMEDGALRINGWRLPKE